MLSQYLLFIVLVAVGIIVLWFTMSNVLLARAWMRLRQRELPTLEMLEQRFDSEPPKNQTHLRHLLKGMMEDGEQGALRETFAEMPVVLKTLWRTLHTKRFAGDDLAIYNWNEASRFSAGIYIFLGLLGTVTGIAVALFLLGDINVGISEDLVSRQAGLLVTVAQMLSALSGAFWATLAGLVATITQSFLNYRYTMACHNIASRLNLLAEVYLLPLFSDDLDLTLIDSLREAGSVMAKATTDMAKSAKGLQDLTPSIKQMDLNISQSVQGLQAAVEQVQPSVISISKTMQDEFDILLKKVHVEVEQLAHAGKLMSEFMQSSMGTTDVMNRAGTAMQEQIAMVNQVLQQVEEEMATFPKTSAKIAESVRDLTRRLEKVVSIEDERTMLLTNGINDLLNKTEKLLVSFEQRLMDVANAVSTQALRDSLNRIRQTIDELDFGRLREMVTYFNTELPSFDRVVGSLDRLEQDTSKYNEDLTELLNRLLEAEENNSEIKQVVMQIEELRAGLNSLSASSADVIQGIDEVSRTVGQMANKRHPLAAVSNSVTTAVKRWFGKS
ncbi:MAG: hypothetical protein ACOX44_16925 [Limnochordia bacterium]|jgi:methyl-accepting chemotaxis protein